MTSSVRRWATGVGVAGGAVAAAAMIGTAGAPVARADTPDEVMDQAIALLNQGDSVLLAAPTADLSAQQAEVLAHQATAGTTFDPLLTQLASAEDGAFPGDQAFIATADESFVTGAQNLLSVDQAFVAADQAGDLSGTGFAPADLSLVAGDLGMAGAGVNVLGAAFLALLDPDIGSLGAASAAAAASTPAQLLSEGDADLSNAGNVLSGIDLSGQPSDISSIVTDETQIIGSSTTIQDAIGSFQTEIADAQTQLSGTPGYELVSQATNDLFAQADSGLLNADDALLTSSQLLASTISDGSGLTDADMLSGTAAMLELVGADFGAFGTTFDAAFTPFLEFFGAF